MGLTDSARAQDEQESFVRSFRRRLLRGAYPSCQDINTTEAVVVGSDTGQSKEKAESLTAAIACPANAPQSPPHKTAGRRI
jgi:hypothetical protein